MGIHSIIGGHEIINGEFVNQKVSQVVQAIKEYDPEIEVQFIPERARTNGQAAYRIIHHPLGAEPYIMFHVRRDEDMDFRILQRIIVNDQRHGTVTLSEYEAWEAAQKAVAHQAWLDHLEESNDIAAHVLKTHKNTYKVNDDLVIKEGTPHNTAKQHRRRHYGTGGKRGQM